MKQTHVGPHKLLAVDNQMVYFRGMNPGLNLHIYPSDITSESRMMKITATLAELGIFAGIVLIGVLTPSTKPHETIDALREIRRFPRRFAPGYAPMHHNVLGTLRWSWAIWQSYRGQQVSCINCHSLPVLPLCVALKLRHKAVLVYDTHELETETSVSTGIRRPLLKFLERALIGFSDLTIVVGDMIAQWYARVYQIEKPLVIRNIPFASNAAAMPRVVSPLRDKLGLGRGAIIVLYLGRLSPNRGIERLLDVFGRLNKPIHLVFMGDGPLTERIQVAGQKSANVHWLAPVPMREVVAHARGADMGVSVIDHSCLSYTYAMPNKFFEYLQAGVPVLIGDMPEQREIIVAHQAGWVLPADDHTAISFLNQLTPADVAEKQENAMHISALYSWENEAERLKAAYLKLADRF